MCLTTSAQNRRRQSSGNKTTLIVLVLTALLAVLPDVSRAQTVREVVQNEEAEALFNDGLLAFEEARYAEAYDSFSRVFVEFELNAHTTAAMLMAGKALYAEGSHERAANVLRRLIDDFPDSRYLGAAVETREKAKIYLERERRINEDMITVGMLFPVDQIDFVRPIISAAVMVVDSHNVSNPARPVRLIFKDSGGTEEMARNATEQLVMEYRPDALVGPLYSEEALGASRVADREGIPMLVPLATDEAVSARMNSVLQANPTFEMRGRLMGRYAVERLRIQRFGVLVQKETDAERFADGFLSEVLSHGAEVRIDLRLADERAWYHLGDVLDADTLTYVDAFYVPVTGGTSHDNLRAFLDGIDAIDPEIRLLGNGEWHGLSAATQAEQHQAVFTGDVEIGEDNPYYKDFSNRYEDVYGESPDTMALVGYDVMQYLVTTVKQIDVRSELLDALRNAERFEGVGRSIDFRAGNVNQAISFKSFKDGETIVQD